MWFEATEFVLICYSSYSKLILQQMLIFICIMTILCICTTWLFFTTDSTLVTSFFIGTCLSPDWVYKDLEGRSYAWYHILWAPILVGVNTAAQLKLQKDAEEVRAGSRLFWCPRSRSPQPTWISAASMAGTPPSTPASGMHSSAFPSQGSCVLTQGSPELGRLMSPEGASSQWETGVSGTVSSPLCKEKHF